MRHAAGLPWPTFATLLCALAASSIHCAPTSPAEATPDPLPTCTGDRLFGAPNNNTGLGADQCGATCTCGGEPWSPPAYTDDDLEAWRSLPLLNAFPNLDADPYTEPLPPGPEGADPVCVVLLGEGGYRLETRSEPDGVGFVTHTGACGRCSTLSDLAVYASIPDLTEPVRRCGLDHLFDPEGNALCLEALGFTHPCAQIWMWNTRATRASCGDLCFAALDDPYHHPDGSLNECLACDEQESGPTFLAIAGRTRRNTGLASSMCRPCEEVRPIVQPRAADLR